MGLITCECFVTISIPIGVTVSSELVIIRRFASSHDEVRGGQRDMGPVWFSFFLTNFSENLAVERIWLYRESE
jgi:hypothetical protein